MQLTTCPECGAPAEIERRDVVGSTDGYVEHVKLRCLQRHWFLMPTAMLDQARPCAENRLSRPATVG